MHLIRQGQRIGFTLKEMADIVSQLDQGDLSADQTATLLQEKINVIEAKLAELTDLRQLLSTIQEQACPLRG